MTFSPRRNLFTFILLTEPSLSGPDNSTVLAGALPGPEYLGSKPWETNHTLTLGLKCYRNWERRGGTLSGTMTSGQDLVRGRTERKQRERGRKGGSEATALLHHPNISIIPPATTHIWSGANSFRNKYSLTFLKSLFSCFGIKILHPASIFSFQ